MKYKKLLELYIPLVDFIADIIGSNCEVLLHDIVDVENSVIAIRNGYISGRSLGCPLTDLGFKLLENKTYLRHSAFVNYRSRNDRGENLISSTYYIKDGAGSLIGMLCVNILNTVDQQGHKFLSEEPLKAFFSNAVQLNGNEEITESLSTSLDHVVDNGIQKLIAKYNIAVDRMSPEEKSVIVQELRENGIFKIKGAITKAAAILKTSESTIYRYLAMK
ncbi:helix-turn-helix transcriptional regulator [Pelosinus propionicus]|uniref:Predicted transcriptional regulator YheO, contains PAS and DNA-binding HTH domains n=1 Tax=Pelosinus propionicus DSM 13327 TaxID=1123291 RepID=A0A1I4IHB4_9FIRM|nr:PAS domain-containing protein [Pelosinus propionicus]SFL53156.1 Predicted transcriptional regulator YheO, contains PAS and DNA-binding HTH domains [Pelosinus propionicus DSM 13327]